MNDLDLSWPLLGPKEASFGSIASFGPSSEIDSRRIFILKANVHPQFLPAEKASIVPPLDSTIRLQMFKPIPMPSMLLPLASCSSLLK